MKLVIDGIDFSSKIDVQGYKTHPRREYGIARGKLIDGSLVPDLLTIKKDLSVHVSASEQEDVKNITTACLKESVTVEFNDPTVSLNMSGVYEPDISEIEMAIDTDKYGKTYWYGFDITFTEL